MTMKNNAKFEEEFSCHFKTDKRNLTNFDSNFHQSTLESVKIGTLMGSFSPKQKRYDLNIYREVMCHDIEE